MNATKHCKISVRRWGGIDDDYRAVHDFIDSTKVLCADSRHRIFHTMWAVNYIIVPLFGNTIVNSDGVHVDVKDLCERDHLLVDYANKFIPTLNDFVCAIEIDSSSIQQPIERLHSNYSNNTLLSNLLLSPLDITGKFESLLLTHNSWFLNTIATRLFGIERRLLDFGITPDIAFENMRFESWMDNGLTYPPSAKKLQTITTRN